ncbi:hypothetical protein FO519_002730 [Halicephalobus sp. NKZ332]|nr:hypothetical protein FO519_002730 [Halicephalobus sp. NKZ332]
MGSTFALDSITVDTVSGGEAESRVINLSPNPDFSETLLEPKRMGFKVGGYVEPKIPEEMLDNKVAPMSPTTPMDPPSYDAVMAQQARQKEERKLLGALLLKASHFFGMHPFKAPYTCNGDVCEKRGFRDRLCLIDFILCLINLFVIMNHFRLHVLLYVGEDKPHSEMLSIFSSETTEMMMKTVDCALPMVCVFGMIFTSYHMHNLLRKLTETHFTVVQKKCKLRFWRIVLYCINSFFVAGAVMELLQNSMREIKGGNSTDILQKPLKDMESIPDQIMIAVDRYYFPIINFGVVKIPQLFIMMISIKIALMFRISAFTLTRRYRLTKEILREYFTQLIDVIDVLQSLECCFNKLILAIVTTSVMKIVFTSYVTVRELAMSKEPGMFSMFISDNMNPGQDAGVFVTLVYAINSTCTVFSLLLNIFWTVIFIVPCIWCNEESRMALPVLTSNLVPDDAKNLKDQIIQKLNDHTWGLTLGKFVKVDRAFAISIMSLIFTVVVVWLQLSTGTRD